MSKRFFIILTLVMVASLILGACQGAAPQPEAEEPEAASGGKPWEGVSINILIEGTPDQEYIAQLLPQFEEESGMKVNLEVVNYALMHDKLVPQMTAGPGNGSYDVVPVADYWVGEFVNAGWLEVLDERIANSPDIDYQDYLPSMLSFVGQVDGKAYMLPYYNYAMGVFYRDDLLNDPALKEEFKTKFGRDLALPTTMQEYSEFAEFMTRDTNGDGEIDIFGSSMMGLRPDPISMEWLNYLYSYGGRLYDENWKPIVNNEAGVQAITDYVNTMKKAAPPGAPAYGFDEAIATMSQGKAASMVSFDVFYPVLNDPEKSEVAGKIIMVRIPGNRGLLGGWGWGIPVSAPNPDAAWAFIEWVESKKITKERALLGGSPTRLSVFRDPDVLAKYPWLADEEKIVNDAIPLPIMTRSPIVIEVLGRLLSEAVAGTITPEEAANKIAEEIAPLVDE